MTEINEHQKWPTDKRRYDRNYLRYHGKVCPKCNGQGHQAKNKRFVTCLFCDGLGYVEKKK